MTGAAARRRLTVCGLSRFLVPRLTESNERERGRIVTVLGIVSTVALQQHMADSKCCIMGLSEE
jgi:hypothetical protein